MRLRTFESFWLLKNGLIQSYSSLQKNEKTQIVVIGGGITGALISHALIGDGYDVIMIDKRDVALGSTSATTSMLQYEIDEKLIDLTNKIGLKGAQLCYLAGVSAIQTLNELITNNKLDCGFDLKKSLYLAHNVASSKILEREFQARKECGLEVDWLSAQDILNRYNVVSQGGILSKSAASIDAYKLTHEIIQLNVQKGLKVFDQTTIKKIDSHERSHTITTESGYQVKCKKIIFCNGYESTQLLKEKIATLHYTYAIVSEQGISLPDSLFDTLLWNTEDPYLYARTTEDGRLLVGGEDSAFDDSIMQQQIKEKKSTILQRKIKKLMPGSNFIEDFSWGGVFGSTKDGLPYIGESPEYKNCLWCLGFGGNGITFSIQGMQIILDLLQNKKNPLSHYYRFGR